MTYIDYLSDVYGNDCDWELRNTLSEEDFYSPEDKREFRSGIYDTANDSFAEYAKYFFDTYGDELFDSV